MALRISDLDVSLQRSVFSAASILCILLLLSLVKIIHYVLIGFTLFCVLFLAYVLFLKPLLKKQEVKDGKKGIKVE